MKGIVNLPTVTAAHAPRPALRRSRTIVPAKAARPVAATAPVTIEAVPLRRNFQREATTQEAARAYTILRGDAPEIAGRAVNILI